MDVPDDFVLDGPDRDAEDALAPTEHVDHLFRRMGRVDGLAVTEERDVGEGLVGGETLLEDLDGGADLLQAHARVEQPLDDLELDDVREGAATLRALPGRRPE